MCGGILSYSQQWQSQRSSSDSSDCYVLLKENDQPMIMIFYIVSYSVVYNAYINVIIVKSNAIPICIHIVRIG